MIFVFEEWNKKRYDSEMKNHKLNYVELCNTYFEGYAKDKSVDEIKQLVRQKLEETDGSLEVITQAFTDYIENGHMRLKNKGEMVRHTIF